MNKYADRHAHDTNRVLNSKVNKSGQNITANFSRAVKKGVPHTQRNGTSERSTIGRNTVKQSVNVTQTNGMLQTQPTFKSSNAS